MAKSDDTRVPDKSEKLGMFVQYFVTAVGLIYGSGFLIVFTFFKRFGIDSADFVEAKYIHVGFLFLMACLVIAVPFWWLVWPIRSKPKGYYSRKVWNYTNTIHGYQDLKSLVRQKINEFFYPDWSVNNTHGLHAVLPVLISMILVLWSFVMIVMFATPEFGQHHSKLLICSFLLPMTILILGFLGDLFKGGNFSRNQIARLKQTRSELRKWWILVGGFYVVSIFISNYFRHSPLLLGIYFAIPIVLITRRSWSFLKMNSGNNLEDCETRISTCLWTLYELQWVILIGQMLAFILTIQSDTLELSLSDVLFGDAYFWNVLKQLIHFHYPDLPRGAIYFVFFVILICFLILRNSYRVKQIEQIHDKAHQLAASISVIVIVVPLAYIAILTFAHNVYPYIPFEKGGGDYSRTRTVSITFNANATTATGLPILDLKELLDCNGSNLLIMLDENSSFYFFANTNYAHGPANWRNGTNMPVIYQVSHDAITCVARGK